jgi:DNA-binding IscR family transcriptional regulator
VTLARPSDQITLLEVVKAIDGLHCTDDCLLDIPGCSSAQSCSLHEDWGDLRRRLHEILGSRTIDAFAEELDELGHMLK